MRRQLIRLSLLFAAITLLLVIGALVAVNTIPEPPRFVASATWTDLPNPLPADFSLLPAFTPAYACQLRSADVYDSRLCRSERLTENEIGRAEGMALIDQASHIGRGCWTGINTDIRHLIRCDLSTGERMNVISHVISSYVRSPDGAWVAFTTFNWAFNSGNGTPSSAAVVGVYRVRVDGSGLQKLNTRPLSVVAVGATEPIWSDDGAWVQVTVWDGTTGGYHPIRIKADGSGENVRLPIIEQPEQ